MYSNSKFMFYEKQYYHELEMKERLDLRLQTVIGFTFAWISSSSYMFRVFDYNESLFGTLFFYNLIATTLCFVVTSLYQSIPVASGINYKKLESPKANEEYRLKLIDYYKQHEPDMSEDEVDKIIYQGLLNDLAEATDHNIFMNYHRGEKCYKSIKWLIFSMIPFALASILFVGFQLDLTHPTKPILIEKYSTKEEFNVREKTTTATATSRDPQCQEPERNPNLTDYKSN